MWFDAPVRLYVSETDVSTEPISSFYLDVKGDITYGEYLHLTSMRAQYVQEYVAKGLIFAPMFQNDMLLDIGISGWSLDTPYSSKHLRTLPYPVVIKIIGFLEKHFWISDRTILDEYTQIVERALRGAYRQVLEVYNNPKTFQSLSKDYQEYVVKTVSEYMKYQSVINIAIMCVHQDGFGGINIGILPCAGGILDQPSKLYRMILIYRDLLIDKINRERRQKGNKGSRSGSRTF